MYKKGTKITKAIPWNSVGNSISPSSWIKGNKDMSSGDNIVAGNRSQPTIKVQLFTFTSSLISIFFKLREHHRRVRGNIGLHDVKQTLGQEASLFWGSATRWRLFQRHRGGGVCAGWLCLSNPSRANHG